LWLTPARVYPGVAAAIERVLARWALRRPACRDLEPALGESQGLLGAAQCAAACVDLARRGPAAVLLTSGAAWKDGSSSLLIEGAR
jgi:hypothetical protein